MSDPKPLNLATLADWLDTYNRWRRGDRRLDMPHPVEIGVRIEEAARAARLALRMAEALAPIAEKYLYPDDIGDEMAAELRAEPEWDEEQNDNSVDDVWLARRTIRRARELRKEAGL